VAAPGAGRGRLERAGEGLGPPNWPGTPTSASPPPREQPEPAARATAPPIAAVLDPRLPAVGTVLTRTYKGGEVRVKVQPDGFEYAGERYASLSAVARAVTGTHTNGFLFFRLTRGGAA